MVNEQERKIDVIRLNEIKLSIDEGIEILPEKMAKTLSIGTEDIIDYRIFKESIDARKGGQIFFVYTVDLQVKNEQTLLQRNKQISKTPDFEYKDVSQGSNRLINRPVIVGDRKSVV